MKKDGTSVTVIKCKGNVPQAPKPMALPPKRSNSMEGYKDGYKAGFADGYREGLRVKNKSPGQKNEIGAQALCRLGLRQERNSTLYVGNEVEI